MSTELGILRSTESETDNVTVNMEEGDYILLLQDGDVIVLDRRQRQELSVLLETWPPK